MKLLKQLKKLSSLALLLCVATQLQAADIDLATAQNAARTFMTKQVANGRLKAAAASNLKLAKAEASVFNPKAVDYYIFNADKSYVVVAGDDQAPEILMYGEEGTIDTNDIPPAMQWMLNKYKYQIDGLKAGTLKANGYTPKATTAVPPMVTANWDQSTPYNNQCPTSGGSRTLTGCPATSLAMCYYKWKWPKTFPAVAAINGSSSGGVSAAALSEREADWDNIIDEYTGPTNYEATTAQKNAVAWLMRYAGQAIPDYMYGTSASGANDPEIYLGVKNMGYTDAQYYMLTEYNPYTGTNSSQNYTDAQWNEWMLTELYAGRPIEYLATDPSAGGHAFNVFGCDTSGKYYVNWGWSGDSNGYCTLHNFTTETGATGQTGSFVFNYGEAMIIGIEPPAGALGPSIKVTPSSLAFEGYAGETYTQTINVKGYNLTDPISIAKSGSNVYSVSHTTISPEDAASGVDVTVTYAPTAAGNHNATITLSCTDEEVENVTVPITGVAQPRVPTLLVSPEALDFNAALDKTVSKTIQLTGAFLEGDVTVTLNDTKGVFTVSPTTIQQNSTNVNTPVTVAVSFNSSVEGTFTGSVTFASNGAESKTVALNATARDGGAATDPYLNIANYETIDEAGASVSGMSSIYKYTEYEDQECAWLTLSCYGAMQADANQNWFTNSVPNSYSKSWSAQDIFPGPTAYFGSNSVKAVYGNGNQTFYVTNCTQVKAYESEASYYTATMSIYECTLNADGSLTPSNTAVDTKTNDSNNDIVLTSINLDASKIYMVKINSNTYPDLFEIGFKTPLSSAETPVATAATEIGANQFTANWTPCTGATSYTLRVMPKPAYTLLMTEGFTKFTKAGSQEIGNNLDNYMDNAGWTGSKVYEAAGGARLGTGSSTGSLTSPALDLTNGGGKVSVVLKAKTFNNDTNCGIKVSCGNNSETVTVADNTEQSFTVVLDCNAAANQNISLATTANSKRVIITGIEIYSGEFSSNITAAAGEMLFSGITGTSHTVTGLEPETTYIYDVKAVYGTNESRWSNVIEVTTLAQESGITLAELLETGVGGNEYTISNDLAVADVADVASYAFLTDGENNWIRVEASSDDVFSAFINNEAIKGGTLKGTLSGMGLNPVLNVTAQPEGTESDFGNMIETFDLSEPFNPKVNQVINVVGYWKADESALRGYYQYPQGQSMTLDYTWGATSNTLIDKQRYTVRCAMNIKEPWHNASGIGLRDYDYDFQNYIGYALRLPSIPTAIDKLGTDMNKQFVNVYNVNGQLVKYGVRADEATKGLAPGIYVINNKKVIVR